MTRIEFSRGWVLLVVQPWGRRYADDGEVGTVQSEFYFSQFKDVETTIWWAACERFACGSVWPSVEALKLVCDGESARPGPEEAWALIRQVMSNELVSIIWTDEMREAYGVASALADDLVAARMAFKESYTSAVSRSRAEKVPVCWSVSLGFDPEQRTEAVKEAARRNIISYAQANKLIGYQDVGHDVVALTKIGKSM